ncbi:MAG: hypothetical protein ABI137_12650 [Antricoccus sp.]
MDSVTLTFLVIGGIGLALLVISLVVGDLLHLGGVDADGPFSVPAIAAFFGAIGFVGAISAALIQGSLRTTPTALLSGAIGLVAAVPVSWGAIRLTRALMNMATDPTLTDAAFVGALGTVVTPITGTGYGEVRIRVQGNELKYAARSATPLVVGTPIYVVEALSPTSVEVVSTAER